MRIREHVVRGVDHAHETAQVLAVRRYAVVEALEDARIRRLDALTRNAGRDLEVVVVGVNHVLSILGSRACPLCPTRLHDPCQRAAPLVAFDKLLTDMGSRRARARTRRVVHYRAGARTHAGARRAAIENAISARAISARSSERNARATARRWKGC